METLSNLKARLDIEDVAGRYTDLSRNGTSLKGLCPLHEERTPSFSVRPERQSFKCFGCGAGGDVLDLIAQAEGISLGEVLARYGNEQYDRPVTMPARKPPSLPPEPDKVVPFADVERTVSRSLDSPLLAYWTRYASEDEVRAVANEYYIGHKDGRTLFWQTDIAGQVRNAKGQAYLDNGKRTGQPGPRYTREQGYGQTGCFGLHLLTKYPDKLVCIVEGEKNAFAGALLFPEYIWIATGSASRSLPPEALILAQDRQVWLWPDMDEAGLGKPEEIDEAGLVTPKKEGWLGRLQADLPDAINRAGQYSSDVKGWDLADDIEYLLGLPPDPEPKPVPDAEADPEPALVSDAEADPEGIRYFTLFLGKEADPAPINTDHQQTPPYVLLLPDSQDSDPRPSEYVAQPAPCDPAPNSHYDRGPSDSFAQPTLNNYADSLDQVRAFFSWYPLPDGPVQLDVCTNIADPAQFVKGHLEILAGKLRPSQTLPYLRRLYNLMQIL